MFCSNCGKPVGDTDRFCHYCGACLMQEDTQPTPPPQPEPQPDPQPEPQPEPQPTPQPEPQPEPQPTPQSEPQPTPQPTPQPEPQPTPQPEPEPQPAPNYQSDAQSGAAPQYNTPPQYGAPQYNAPQQPSGNTDSIELALKIFAVICGVVYGLRALQQAISFLSSLPIILEYFPPIILISSILSLIGTMVYAWITVMLILLAFRRTPQNTRGLTFGLVIGGVAALVLLVLQMLLFSITFHHFNTSPMLHIVGVLISVGGVYGLLYAIGQAPSAESLLQNPAADLQDACASIGDGVRSAQQGAQQNAQQRAQQDASAASAAYAAGGTIVGGPVKTDRSLLMYILLGIITCGIYNWYFIYSLARDVNIMCREDGKNTGGLLAFILLSIITCGFYALYWEYSLGNRLAANAPRYGMVFQENGTTVLLWYLVGIFLCGIGPYVAMHILIKNSNALGVAYNHANGY